MRKIFILLALMFFCSMASAQYVPESMFVAKHFVVVGTDTVFGEYGYMVYDVDADAIVGLRYNTAGHEWELSNDGAAWSTIATAAGVSPNLWETISSDSGSTVADDPNDTLTFGSSKGIDTSIAGDTVTIVLDLTEVNTLV